MSTVAIDGTYVVDPRPTGVSVYSRRLIESLAGIETPHRFLIGYRVSRWRRHTNFIRFENCANGWRPPFSTVLFQDPWTFWLPWQADLFHSLAQRPAPFRFRNEVVTVFDLFPLVGRGYSAPSFQRKFTRLLIEAAGRAARVITPSQYTADELVRHTGTARDKICVIPLGVDMPNPDRFFPAPGERERWAGKGNELILMVGVVQTRKNTLGALHALERLPQRYHMALVGGDGYGSEPVHEYIQKSGLGSRLRVVGYASREVVESLYRAASVLLFPSFEEGFGLPVLEAMARGLPVIASGTSSLPEVGGEAVVYVNPRDEGEMAAQVIRACEDHDLRKQMIQKGLERVKEFSWGRMAKATLSVYNQVLTDS